MLVRPSTENDVDALRELWRATWRDTYAPRIGPSIDAACDASLEGDAIRSMFATDGGCRVAVEGRAILGSICFAERGPVAYVWGMYVHPSRQRSGIGTALMRDCALSFGRAERIDLSAIDDRALAFYRKLGFAEQGRGEVELFPDHRVPTTRLVIAVRDVKLAPHPRSGP